jgi:exopolysaccharide biosynthesis polyprenyl glycosylphosphotransferase
MTRISESTVRPRVTAATPVVQPRTPIQRATSSRPKRLLIVADALCITVCLAVAYAIRASGTGPDIEGARFEHLALGIVAIPVWVSVFARQRLYVSRFISRRVDEWRRILHGSAYAVVALAAGGYALQLNVSRAWMILAAALVVGVVGLEREIARHLFARMRCQGKLLRNVIIVGSNDEARELATMLADDPTLGYRVVGFVADADDCDDLLGTAEETLDVLRRTGASGVIVAASAMSVAVSNRLVRELVHCGIHVELSSTLRDVAPERLTVRPLGRFPVVYLEPRHPDGWRFAAKRAFDLVVSLVGLVLIAPLCAAVALAIKLDTRGGVVFKQVRVGKDGVPFSVWKFRTMVPDAEARVGELLARNEADGPLFKLKDDPRVTRVGRFLRKTSFDELPQLVNVVRGEMSLVGPRPALPAELLHWDAQLHARLRVKPGITGMWQVSGRSDASFESYSRLDLYYVDNWSLLSDLAILAKTVPSVLFGRGAY